MKGRELHFIGIGGAGMSGLALVAHELGATVTGSDRADSSYIQRLRVAGLDPAIGHDAEAVPPGAEVVISTAIGDDNPELARARERGQSVLHRSELLAELSRGRRVIAVAGTHGKTTTTAMIVHALRQSGAAPAFFIGGELPGAGAAGEPANAGLGDGEWMVVEADESDGSFLRLEPEVAVVTNLELDHHSRWGSLAELRGAFGEFAAPARALVIGAEVDLNETPGAAGERTSHRFGLAGSRRTRSGEGWVVASELSSTPTGTSFTAAGVPAGPGDSTGAELDVSLTVHGEHNVLNAVAALAAIGVAGTAEPDAAAAALSSFPGVARRMELKGSREGARIYDDYAHHPTEVDATLAAARELGGDRVIAVFQPHLYSRTKALALDFGRALAAADEVAVLEVYPAREEPVGELEGVSGRRVAEAAADAAPGKPVWWLPDRDKAAEALGSRLGPGDVLLTIGAGDIFKLADALVEGS